MSLIPGLKVPAFSRLAWVSSAARAAWEPTIARASTLVNELEVLSVLAGHRPCAWQQIPEKDFLFTLAKLMAMGLLVLPVKKVGASPAGFAHYHEAPRNDGTDNVCFIVAKRFEDAVGYRLAFEAGDHEKQGHYLGFPPCCTKFFSEWWTKGYIDPIWQAAENSGGADSFCIQDIPNCDRVRVKKHPWSNPMLRYAGVRVCFHIPCSFSCAATIAEAERRVGLAEDKGPLQAFERLLRMPMSWDVLAGTAVVRTPLFYIITSSVAEDRRLVVEAEGDFIPEEAAAGLVFPFRRK